MAALDLGQSQITTAVDSASCVANSTLVTRTPSDPTQCQLSLSKPSSGTDMVDVLLTGLPAGASSNGKWTGNTWTTTSTFSCSLSGGTYSASLQSPNGSTSSCGSFTLQPKAPVCGGLTVTRPTATSTTCPVTMTKGANSGPITSAIINGAEISTADQATYTTTVSCPIGSTTAVTGSLSNSSGVANCPSTTVGPVLNTCTVSNLTIGSDRILGASSTRYDFPLKNLLFPADVQEIDLRVTAIGIDDYYPIIYINGVAAVSVVESDSKSHAISLNAPISSFIKGGTNTVTCSVMNRYMSGGKNWAQCVYVVISGSYKTAGQCTQNANSTIYQY